MNKPLLLRPSGKDYLWGGQRLNTEFEKGIEMSPLAETWECSTHPDGPCFVAEGEFAGQTLGQVLSGNPAYLGSRHMGCTELPLLIKFIDAREDLSVQVHPTDAYAKEHEHGQLGKTEMWYVLDAAKNARLVYGLRRDCTQEEIREAIEKGKLTRYLQYVPIRKGDLFFIEAGTIHAIGAGALVAEIQENSNVTYRVYDYGRKDANGKERDLHIEKALQVTKRVPILRKKSFEPHIVDCDYFTVDKVVLDGQRMKKIFGEIDKTSFTSLLVLDGTGKVQSGEECVEVQKGDSVFITANAGEYEMEGKFEALLTTV